MDKSLLEIRGLSSGYGDLRVLQNICLHLKEGEIIGVIGHNGAGKSTLLRAIVGLSPLWSGQILLSGSLIHFHQPSEARLNGVAYFPQGGRVFPSLSIRENLLIGGAVLRDKQQVGDRISEVYERFPILHMRSRLPASSLSGGERQMLALATGLMSKPRLLLVDEPSLGLSPRIAKEVLSRLHALAYETGAGVIVVEQRVRELVKHTDRIYALRRGQVSYEGVGSELLNEAMLMKVYL